MEKNIFGVGQNKPKKHQAEKEINLEEKSQC